MSGQSHDDTNRSLDDLLGAATRDLHAEVDQVSIEPFRPSPRRSPLVAAAAVVAIVGIGAFWVSRPGPDTVVTGPATTFAPDATTVPDSLAPDSTDLASTVPDSSVAPDDQTPAVSDLEVRVVEPLDQPAPNETYFDPAFGQQITRITDSAAGEYIAPLTTLGSAFNADETKLLLYRTTSDGGAEHRVHDLTTGTATVIDIAPSDIEEVAWSPAEPDIVIYVEGTNLVRFDVVDETEQIVRAFEACDGLVPAVGGAGLSADGDLIALACVAPDGADDTVLTYRFSTDTVVAVPRDQNPDLFTQAPRVGPSGELFVFPTESRLGAVLDASLSPTGVEIDPLSTTAIDVDGADIAVGPAYGGDLAGSLVATDLATGASRRLVAPGPGSTSITSGITVAASGQTVVFSNEAPDGADPDAWAAYDGEVVLIDLSGAEPVVTRLAHNRTSNRIDYWSSTFVAVSPSGDRVAFSSDWGTGTSVDTYVIDVRTAS